MEGDIVQMGAYIGAGLACTGMGGAAVGVGHVVGNFIAGALRNPSAAAGQNILLALNALGFGGIWRTGKFALNKEIGSFLELDDNQEVLGYLYIGTPTGDNKKIPQLDPKDFVRKL